MTETIQLKNPDRWWEEIKPWKEDDPSFGHYFKVIEENQWIPKGSLIKCIQKPDDGDRVAVSARWEQKTGIIRSNGVWWLESVKVRYHGPHRKAQLNQLPKPVNSLDRFKNILKEIEGD